MAEVLVIFGAGASYDLINTKLNDYNPGFQPPLMKNLFDNRFDGQLKKFGLIQNSLQALRNFSSNGGNIEKYMEDIKEKANRNPELDRYLLEIQFYLQLIFHNINLIFLVKIT